MFPVRKLMLRLLLTGGALALTCTAAYAADSAVIPYRASVDADSAVLLESEEEGAAAVVSLEHGDTLVLLSNEDTGLLPAAWEDEDEVYTGYVDAGVLTPEPLGEAAVLSENAALLTEAADDAGTVLSLSQDEPLEILGYGQGWYYVEAEGRTGYVSVADVDAPVTTTSRLNLRAEPNTDSEILEVLPSDTDLSPVESDGEWFQVSYNGQTGYISSDYVSAPDAYIVKNPSMTAGEAVVAYAQQFLGNRYVWGGTSLTNGCDCSGYVMQVYAQFGVSLPHSSSGIRNYGEKVSYSEMEVGDVVCYNGHVGIYAGNGQIINALNSRSGICYTNVNYASIVTIRRML